MKQKRAIALLLAALLLAAPLASGVLTGLAQTGGDYSLTWSSVDGGGAASGGGAYQVAGLAGQPDAGQVLAGGDYAVAGGYWAGVPAPTVPKMFVQFIYLTNIEPQPGLKLVLGLVRILDESFAPVAGATVDMEWTLPIGGGYVYPVSKPTNANGLAFPLMFYNWSGTYELCVTDVTAPGYIYDPGMNYETCDSITLP